MGQNMLWSSGARAIYVYKQEKNNNSPEFYESGSGWIQSFSLDPDLDFLFGSGSKQKLKTDKNKNNQNYTPFLVYLYGK